MENIINESHSTTLHLAKQNFKFSAAHFLIFDAQSAEMLHGHNYSVKVDITGPSVSEFQNQGYFIDFSVLKKIIKELCDAWDEHVLLPELHPDMKKGISESRRNFEVHFRDRFYSFPVNEVIWLPITNTSVENLSLLFARYLFDRIQDMNVQKVQVYIEETAGQSASAIYGK